MRKALLAVVAVCAAWGMEAGLAIGSKAPAWALTDASEVKRDSSQYANKVLLIIGGDKKSQESNNDWGERVRKACPSGMSSVALADTSAVPRLLRGYYRGQFQGESSRMGVPYLLDWDGSVTHSFAFKPGVSNVVLIGPDDTVLAVFTGTASDDSVKKLCGVAGSKMEGH